MNSLIITRTAPQMPQTLLLKRRNYLNNLREMFANKGKEYRAFLKSEKVKDLYTSPMTVEMSAEDILAEIPREDLHLIGTVRGMLIMPPSFVHKY